VNTIDTEPDAKTAEVLLSVNTIEYDTNAKTAEVVRFVNTIDNEASAKNAEVVKFVNTIGNDTTAKNAKIPDQLDEYRTKFELCKPICTARKPTKTCLHQRCLGAVFTKNR